MEELKPCPFCGKSMLTIEFNDRSPNLFPFSAHVLCLNCLASVGSHGFEQTQHEAELKARAAWNRRAAPENDSYMDGVKYAIYEIFKEADISGSQEIRDSEDTDDGMCARAAERIRAELTAAPENKALTNFDHIAASPGTLAEFMSENPYENCGDCPAQFSCRRRICSESWFEWLNQPYARRPEAAREGAVEQDGT